MRVQVHVPRPAHLFLDPLQVAEAERAGLKSRDVVLSLGGGAVENIDDLLGFLDDEPMGKPYDVVILRAGKKMSLSVTPCAAPTGEAAPRRS
jgi:S1-C subfamily serine protease